MAELYPFSEYARQLLAEGPIQGGTHRWLAQVSAALRNTLSAEDMVAFLREVCDGYVTHRVVDDVEIMNAVDFARGEERRSGPVTNKSLSWPVADAEVIRRVLGDTGGKRQESTTLIDVDCPLKLSAGEALRGLFLPGELVCGGLSSDLPEIRPVDAWMGDAEQMQFVAVNPMRGQWGVNLKGKVSKRCQSNMKHRRYLVAEFDDPRMTKEMQAKLVTALGRVAPLVMVVDSAGKSLHGWFRVEELSAKDQARFFAMACVLGADRSRWDICGWLRMPGGLRPKNDQKVRQRILFASSQRGAGGSEVGDGGDR
ncbi:hypothetical protein P0Y35_09625 [Kiritimatiellaeota bacterium B1221]|nr:hypothetical protein [Kiritimatiellaeota bacterium B1221]